VPILRGRAFEERDRAGAERVVVVNQRLAHAQWGDTDPRGRRISTDGGRTWRTIVGVVGDVRQEGLESEPGSIVYLPLRESPGSAPTVFVRTQDDPARVAEDLRGAARRADPQTAVSGVRTLEDIRGEALSSPRLTSALLGLFAALALVITAAGLGGLIAYS